MTAHTTSTFTDALSTHRDHDRFLESGAVSARVRDLVAESWLRSAAAGVDADRPEAPVAIDADELRDYREAHPLSQVFPLLYDVLGRAAEECDSLLAVGDSDGRLLWVCGRPGVLAQAEGINFAEGTSWDEGRAGTNAPGTALRLDAPVQIRAAEHFRRAVQPWTCAAAPIHDPITQAILGVVDVTGTETIASPQTMAMVRAAARMAEAELGRIVAVSGRPKLWSSAREPVCRLEGLGRPDCQVDVDGRTSRLTHRHSEIMVLLVDRPEGLTGDQLAIELYADDVRGSTIRAELTRLRALLGADLLDSRPYRLRSTPACDWLRVGELIEAGRVAEAIRAYRGPLLPQSDAPGVVARRERLERDLRAAVYASGDLDLMMAWTRSRWGADDVQMWERQAGLLPESSPLRPLAVTEVRRLNRELGA
ncbi:MAG TPA: GAF domain-containing protein [Jatrophihabitans sp.]|uniref:GAF domain-containing protein n=1 Tax=Jatrophihabitans sp. TaxID=1932789 RepID=UPI002DFD8C02|nr:GAF domain-containing protein [Jatrophihabitans sp.]